MQNIPQALRPRGSESRANGLRLFHGRDVPSRQENNRESAPGERPIDHERAPSTRARREVLRLAWATR